MEPKPLLVRLSEQVEAAHAAALVLERVAFVWLARVGLAAVVLANADKARWLAAEFSESGAWSPVLLAYGVELVFAIGAYWLAHRLQTGEGRLSVLVVVVVVFAAISAVANMGYFEAHRPDLDSWTLAQAVALGLAAPCAAVAIAFLTGDLSAVSQREHQRRARLERAAAKQAHDQAMSELAVAQAREMRLAANAEARKAKALAQAARPVIVPEASSQDTSAIERGHPWSYEDFYLHIQENDLSLDGLPGDAVGAMAGVSARTGRNWLARYRQENGTG